MCDAHTYIQQERLSGDATWRFSTIGFRRRDMAGLLYRATLGRFISGDATWRLSQTSRNVSKLPHLEEVNVVTSFDTRRVHFRRRDMARTFYDSYHASFFLQVTAKIYVSHSIVSFFKCDSFVGPKKDRLSSEVSIEKLLTWRRCTWSQPWCPQTRRAWPVHRGAGDGRRSESPGR